MSSGRPSIIQAISDDDDEDGEESKPVAKKPARRASQKIPANQTNAKLKLPSVPISAAGERPYYSEVYHRWCTSIRGDECVSTVKDLIWGCHAAFSASKFERHYFLQNEKLQRCCRSRCPRCRSKSTGTRAQRQ